MPDLKVLPPEVRSHLRSGVAICSLSQCCEELALNAIDAGATCVALRVDTSICRVQVVDNGHGMDREQLGKVANRYSSSKCHCIRDMERLRFHGYRGEALASIRNLCAILEIESRARGVNMTYRIAFQGSDISAVEESKRPRASVGTTVTVHNLFHNMPVRRKRLDESLEFEMVKRLLEGISLQNPKISFSLRNDVTGKMALKTQKCDSIQGTFTALFGLEKSRHLEAVEVTHAPFKFSGYISTEAHSNKQLQYIYINGRIVLKSRIHKVVSWILQKRSVICRRKGVGRSFYSPTGANASPPKTPERHGVYVLNLECPLNEYDITFDPRKTLVEFKDWTGLLKLLKDLVYNFLRRNNLLAQENDYYKGNTAEEKCTFADPVLQEVFNDEKDDSPESAIAPRDHAPGTLPEFAISAENAIGNLQSKTVRRKSAEATETKSADVAEKTDMTSVADLKNAEFKEKHLCELDPSTDDPSFIEETPEDDIPGAELTAALNHQAIDGGRKCTSGEKGESFRKPEVMKQGKSSCNIEEMSEGDNGKSRNNECAQRGTVIRSKHDVEDPLVSLNSTLALAPPEREPRKLAHNTEPTQRAKVPRMDFTNNKRFPTGESIASESAGDKSAFAESDFTTVKQPENSATLANRLPIELPPGSHRVSSIALLREELKRQKSAEEPAVETKPSNETKPPASVKWSGRNATNTGEIKLSGLQKLREKMLSSCPSISYSRNGRGSDGGGTVHKHSGDSGACASHDGSGEGNFSVSKLRKLAQKMKGQSRPDENARSASFDISVKCGETTATIPNNTSSASDGDKYAALNTHTCGAKNTDSRATSRKRSCDSQSAICDELTIPCKNTRTNCDESLVKTCDNQTVQRRMPQSRELEAQLETLSGENVISQSRMRLVVDPLRVGNSSAHSQSSTHAHTTQPQTTFLTTDSLFLSFHDFEKRMPAQQPYKTNSDKSPEPPACVRNVSDSKSSNNARQDITLEKPVTTRKFNFTGRMDVEPPSENSGKRCVERVQTPCENPAPNEAKSEDVEKRPSTSSLNMRSRVPFLGETWSVKSKTEKSALVNSSRNDSAPVGRDGAALKVLPAPERNQAPPSQSAGTVSKNVEKLPTSGATQSDITRSKSDEQSMELEEASIDCTDKHTKIQKHTKNAVTAPFRPTISSEFCVEFSPLKFDSETSAGSGNKSSEAISKSPSNVKTSGNSSAQESQGFRTVSAESQCFDLGSNFDLGPGTQPFAVTSTSDQPTDPKSMAQTFSNTGEPVSVGVVTNNKNVQNNAKLDERNSETQGHTIKDGKESDIANQVDSEKHHTREGSKLSGEKVAQGVDVASGAEDKKSESGDSAGPKVVFVSGSWICQIDPNTGERVYVNKITGQTSNEKPGTTTSEPVLAKVRRHGACDDAVLSGWAASTVNDGTSVRAQYASPSNLPPDSATYTSYKQWENPMFSAPSDAPRFSVSDGTQAAKRDVKVQSLVQPQRFTKHMLQTAKVLKQVGDKFIICIMAADLDADNISASQTRNGRAESKSDILVVVDQHAAHERVRLEQLTASLCGVEGLVEKSSTDLMVETSEIKPPLEVSLSADVIRLIKAFKAYVTLTGVEFREQPSDGDKVLVSRVPACLIGKEIAQMKHNKTQAIAQLVKEYLSEQAELLKQTSGSVSSLPPTLHHILCSQACHGAIKFGDPLTTDECVKLMSSLSECALPFQCAHGRPSCMPLLHLNNLNSDTKPSKPAIWKLRQRMENERIGK